MSGLRLGPLLRWVDRRSATVWVETDAPGEVAVLGGRAATFEIAGHHYALVTVDLTGRGEVTPYEVAVDGEVVWPPPDDAWPAPVIRKPSADRARIVFGSCRAAAPDVPPWTLPRAEHPDGVGLDALEEYARRLADLDHDQWPDLLLMLGDQVYADMASPETRAYARSRRDTSRPPYDDVADFEEYTRLYQESWSDPEIRWLLSTVPTAMVFDDHDIIDDWNISASWVADMRATEWWHDRIVGGLVAYWCYQHPGNLPPGEVADDPVLRAARQAEGDAWPALARFAEEADRDPATVRWSFARRLADTDLVVLDARAARVLAPERDMLDADEWHWLEQRLADPAPVVLVASTLPVLLPEAIHDVEAASERICDGAWGPLGRRAGEALRRAVDLEHWAAFSTAFARLTGLLRDVAGRQGVRAVAILSGDVHNGSIDRAQWPETPRPLWQVVASPMRQEVAPAAARAFRLARTPVGRAAGRVLRRLTRAPAPGLQWRTVDGPVLRNHVGVVEVDGEAVRARLETVGHDEGLTTSVERRLR